ncbi:MAG TPA: hypothetical protein VK698_06525 [Kofleriaceae bacterium]|nr:hypothetical protein [Kofleriaceae bacterium]
MRPLARLALVAAALAACGDNADAPRDASTADASPPGPDASVGSLDLPDGCQPLLAGQHCTLPFPSDYFLVDDPSTATGKRVQPTGAAQLMTTTGLVADVYAAEVHDGASAIPTIVASLPDEVVDTGLAHVGGPGGDSVADDARTILLAPDGTRVPHYVDVDPRATDPMRRAIVIHPLVGLEPRTRYVVALRRFERADGDPAAAAEGFRRLRDQQAAGEPLLAPLVDSFESDVFAPLADAGWERGELQLAWTFTVGSREAVVDDMLEVRAATVAWLAENQPTVAVETVDEEPKGQENVWRIVRGTVTGPLFLEADQPGAALARDRDGHVVQNGTTSFDFIAVVPASVRDQKEPGVALTYGHGFFGGLGEVGGGSARTIADSLRAVVFGVVWVGMSTEDIPGLLANLTGDPGRTVSFADRVHQSIANWIVMGAAIQGPMLEQEALQRVPGGEPVYAPDPLGYLGISQGGILGGVMTGLNPYLDRICLQVPGAGFTHMMFRARPFGSFLAIIQQILPDAMDQQLFAATLQGSFDRFDPGIFGSYLLREPLDEARPLLMQAGLGDVSVPNLGTFLLARQIGVPLVEPSPAEVYGLETTDGPGPAGLTLFDFGIDLSVYDEASPAPEDNEVHESVRLEPTALDQLDQFLRQGTVAHPCEGPCDPG